MARTRRKRPPKPPESLEDAILQAGQEALFGDHTDEPVNSWDCAAWWLIFRLLRLTPYGALEIIRMGLTGDLSPEELGFSAVERRELVVSVLHSAESLLIRHIERAKRLIEQITLHACTQRSKSYANESC